MLVTPHFYGHLVTLLSGLANGKLVVLLEGGYFKESLAEGVACTLKALLGDVCYPVTIESNPTIDPSVQEVINNVKYLLRDYWKCFQTEELFNYPKLGHIEVNDLEEHVTCLEYRKIIEDTNVYATVDCYPVQGNDVVEGFTAMIQELREGRVWEVNKKHLLIHFVLGYSKGRVCNNIVGYVYDELLLHHKPTGETGKCPPERPERLIEIIKRFEEFGLRDRFKQVEVSTLRILSF